MSTNLLDKTVLVILSLVIITTLGTGQISKADSMHCDRIGDPSCYSVGFSDEQSNPGASCSVVIVKNFVVDGWDAGAGAGSSPHEYCAVLNLMS